MTPDRHRTTAPPEGDDDHRLVIHQFGATEAGFFRTCRLPRCRRARRCTGCPRPGGEAEALPDSATLPPCIVTGADIRRLIDGVMDVDRIIREAWGLVPGEEDDDTAADAAGDGAPLAFPPPEGLARVRKPGRHGGRRARRGRLKTQETCYAQETPSASAEIQNTASCDSAVSSQTKSRCGNSSSRISRPEPISQIMPPSGLR